jgi:uncharacterized membrane protein
MSESYEESKAGIGEISDDDRLLMPEKREQPFIKYHAVLALITGVVGIVLSFLCVGVIILVAMFYFAYKAYQGERVDIPVLTDFAESQGWV